MFIKSCKQVVLLSIIMRMKKARQIDGIEKGFDAKTKKLVFERTWKNGKKHGLWREYYPNSKLKYEGFYKDNLPTGTWKFYTPQGELESTQEY